MGFHNRASNGNDRHEKLSPPNERDREIYRRRKVLGETIVSLGQDYGVSHVRISQITAEVESWLRKEFKTDIEALKIVHTERLEQLFDEAMEGWRRSQKNSHAVTERDSDGEKSVEKSIRGQTGDARFLAQAAEALAHIRKIWGADAPAKTENTNYNVPFETREQLHARLVKLRQNLEPQEN